MGKSIKKPGKKLIRIFFYVSFLLAGLQAIIQSSKDTTLPLSVIIMIFLFVSIFLIGFAELFTWIIYKLLTLINYFGLKKPHKYEKDIKRFVLIFVIGSVAAYIIGAILMALKIIPTIELFWRETNWWLIILDILYFISLYGLYKLKKWGLHLYIIINIAFHIEFQIFDYKGISGLVTSFLLAAALIGYPYVRKEVFN